MVEYKPEPNTERAVKFASKLIAKAGADDICLAFFETVVNFLLTVSWQHLIYTTLYIPVIGCHVLIQTACFFEDCYLLRALSPVQESCHTNCVAYSDCKFCHKSPLWDCSRIGLLVPYRMCL